MDKAPNRLREVLARDDLRPLLERLKKRLQQGKTLTGRMSFHQPSPLFLQALLQLFGRRPQNSTGFSFELEELESLVLRAQLAPSLGEAVQTLCGPIDNQREKQQQDLSTWENLFEHAQSLCPESERKGLHSLQRLGLLKRLSQGKAELASLWLEGVLLLLREAPYSGLPLAQIASERFGNAHALDNGQPRNGIFLHFYKIKHQSEEVQSEAEMRRQAYGEHGILCDELSAPILVWNLRAVGRGWLDQLLQHHHQVQEPCRLSIRMLLRHSFQPDRSQKVMICENPSLVAMAASRYAGQNAPCALICTEGQLTTSGHLLLRILQNEGLSLQAHGDFDWPGVKMVRHLMSKYSVGPWRFGEQDYREALKLNPTPTPLKLEGQACDTPWAPELALAMAQSQVAIHEEALAEPLLPDLG